VAGAVWNKVGDFHQLLSTTVYGEGGAILIQVGIAHAGKGTYLQ